MFKLTKKHTPASSCQLSNDQYEVAEFAIRHGLSIFEARRILKEAGADRAIADAAGEQAKSAAGDRL